MAVSASFTILAFSRHATISPLPQGKRLKVQRLPCDAEKCLLINVGNNVLISVFQFLPFRQLFKQTL
jgi:hypothetical protein